MQFESLRLNWYIYPCREFYPEKNQYEAKAKKDYGNKAYQQGKDLDALYLYTQVTIILWHLISKVLFSIDM